MAKEALKRLEEQLNCSICLDTYTDPKLLQCFHVYCQQCLVPLVKDKRGQLSLTCPTCRQVMPVPDRGVAGLKPAFHINHLLEIYYDSVKKLPYPAATPEGAVGGTKPVVPPRKKALRCSDHSGEELKLYCETCGELVCYQCVIKTGGKHQDHRYVLLKTAFEKYKEEIASSLEPMEKQVTTIKKALSEISTRCGEISDQRAAIEDNVHIIFRRLREVLTVRETELIDQLHQMTQSKLKGLAAQRDLIETTLGQLNRCLHFMRESLRSSKESDVLMMKTNTVQRVKELTTPFQRDMLKPNTEADMGFSILADITPTCQNYGQVSSLHSVPSPFSCRVTGKGVEGVATVGRKSTAILEAVNFGGTPFESMKCELESEITGTSVSCRVERRGQSQYEISYKPEIKGRHQLHVKVEGQHIRGSPFDVVAKLPVLKISTPILTIRKVGQPQGVAITRSGELVVTQQDKCCITIYSISGKPLRSFGTRGSNPGQFQFPRGVAVDSGGNILVADLDNQLQKFTPRGRFLAAAGTKGSGPLQFNQPISVAVSSTNDKVYVADSNNHRIQVLNSDLTFSSSFGKKGSGKGQFSSPWGVACDSTGNVYVADINNNRIQVFTAEGRFVRMFGRRGQDWARQGQDWGKLEYPNAIAVDGNDMVYVSDGSCRVMVFTPDCQFVTSFGGVGEENFILPSGLAVDESGVVCVCASVSNLLAFF